MTHRPALRRRPSFRALLATALATALPIALPIALLAAAVPGAALLGGCAGGPGAAAPAQPPLKTGVFRVLVFSKTAGFRHGPQIALGHRMFKDLADKGGYVVDPHSGEDPKVFTDEVLKGVDVVVFLNTTEPRGTNLLGDEGRAAFERFIRGGGGFVGIHSATDTGYEWPFYSAMIGTQFACHPAVQLAVLETVDRDHPSTRHLGGRFPHSDEWYNYDKALPAGCHELVRVDEATYKPGKGAMGDDHPISWTHEYAGGRCFYTEAGHTEHTYGAPWFRQHVLGGLRWAAQRER